MLYCAYTCDYVIFSSFSQASRNFLANFREGARKSLNRAENWGGLGIIRDDSGSIRKVLKTVWVNSPQGFESLHLRQKIRQVSTCRIFLSKPQAWHIIATQSWISSAPMGLYLITRQRASTCGLMIYNTSCW